MGEGEGECECEYEGEVNDGASIVCLESSRLGFQWRAMRGPRVAQKSPKFQLATLKPPSLPSPRSTANVVVGSGSGMGAAAAVEAPRTRQSTVARRVRVEANMVARYV